MTTPKPQGADLAPDRLFSLAALRRAWRLVRRSGPSVGTDGVKLPDFERNLDDELKRLRHDILTGTYRPLPVNRFYLRKASGKRRPITVWTVRDRVAQRVIHDHLTPVLENVFLDCSFGFRPGRSVPEAVQAVVRARDANKRWVVDADIADCFDSIPLDLLMVQVRAAIPSALAVQLIELWIHTPVHKQPGAVAGVSQGGVISPQLANLYLHRFDQMIAAALPETPLVRFADDFILLNRRKNEARWALAVAQRSLRNLRLTLNMEKTRVVHFADGFTFLGVSFHNNRVFTTPSKEN